MWIVVSALWLIVVGVVAVAVILPDARTERARAAGIAFLFWSLPAAALYGLGWAVGWIVRGFRHAKPDSPEDSEPPDNPDPLDNPDPHGEAKKEPVYFPVSATKFIVLSLFSFGFYQLYWSYRNWKLEKARTGEKLSPFWRAAFAPLFSHSLFTRIRERATQASVSVGYSAGTLAVAYFALNVAWRLPDPFWLISVLVFVPFLPVRAAVAAINKKQAPQASRNSRFSVGNVVLVIGGGLLWYLVGLGLAEPGDYKDSYVRAFTNSCTQAAVRNGSPEDKARRMCGCIAHHFVDRHTTTELISYWLIANSPEQEKGVMEARSACQAQAAAEAEKAFKVSYARDFVDPCTRVSVSNGYPEDKAKPLCACMAQYLVNNHTSTELTGYQSNPNPPEFKRVLTEAQAACPQN
jgi:hypothetical protein